MFFIGLSSVRERFSLRRLPYNQSNAAEGMKLRTARLKLLHAY
jgi:hypothetical protein